MRTKGDAGLKFTNNQGWMLEVRKIEKMIVKVRVRARDGGWRIQRMEMAGGRTKFEQPGYWAAQPSCTAPVCKGSQGRHSILRHGFLNNFWSVKKCKMDKNKKIKNRQKRLVEIGKIRMGIQLIWPHLFFKWSAARESSAIFLITSGFVMRNNARRSQDSELGKKCCRALGTSGGSTRTETLHFTVVICVKIIYTPCHNQPSFCLLTLTRWLIFEIVIMKPNNWYDFLLQMAPSETLFWTYVSCRYVILLLSENYMPQFRAHIISAPPIIGILISWLAITCGWGWAGVINCQQQHVNSHNNKQTTICFSLQWILIINLPSCPSSYVQFSWGSVGGSYHHHLISSHLNANIPSLHQQHPSPVPAKLSSQVVFP